MRKNSDFIQAIDQSLSQGRRHQLMYREAEDEVFNGRIIHLDGQALVNFGSCSYLGLEMDQRLKEGAIAAIRRYGTQFSSSRGFVSVPLYTQLEDALEEVFGLPPLIAPTTTLAHAAAFPVLIDEQDAVILDQQVHASVHAGINHVRPQGTHVEIVRHNRLDLLEERIEALRRRHKSVWYMADGVYSMYGDVAPMADLAVLLDRYESFKVYVDDAHGMSWHGQRGRGYTLEHLPRHDRMVVATSLAKGFGVCGGILLVPDEEERRKLSVVGSAFTFSGPMQPANLGAALVAARLHASGEIHALQEALQQRLTYCNQLCHDYGLPLYSPANVPIRFIVAGLSQAVFRTARALMEEGFYANCAIFPAVPMTKAGLRFTLTNHQSLEDIERFVAAVAKHLPLALEAEGSSMPEVFSAFELTQPASHAHRLVHRDLVVRIPRASNLQLFHETSIERVDQVEWNRLLGDRGTFSWDGMRFLEGAFGDNCRPENHWGFRYYFVRDERGRPVLATFFTEALSKDDMLAPAHVSAEAEARRREDPYFLTSKVLVMGSWLTLGDHLFLDREGDWQAAMQLLLREVDRERERVGATGLMLRDIPTSDTELDEYLIAQGFARFPMHEDLTLDISWQDDEAYLRRLSRNARKHLKKKVLPFDDHYDVEILTCEGRELMGEEAAHLHRLYVAVADRNLGLNAFHLPEDIFSKMLDHPSWELLLLRLKSECGGEPEGPVTAFVASFKGERHYVPHGCGLDYRFVESHGAYRQMLRHAVRRATELGYERILFGIGATHEKTRFGCKPRFSNVYLQSTNDYQLEVFKELMLDANRSRG